MKSSYLKMLNYFVLFWFLIGVCVLVAAFLRVCYREPMLAEESRNAVMRSCTSSSLKSWQTQTNHTTCGRDNRKQQCSFCELTPAAFVAEMYGYEKQIFNIQTECWNS